MQSTFNKISWQLHQRFSYVLTLDRLVSIVPYVCKCFREMTNCSPRPATKKSTGFSRLSVSFSVSVCCCFREYSSVKVCLCLCLSALTVSRYLFFSVFAQTVGYHSQCDQLYPAHPYQLSVDKIQCLFAPLIEAN